MAERKSYEEFRIENEECKDAKAQGHKGTKERNTKYDIRYTMKGIESCAVIVAHPDDETLWAGGTILMHPETRWTIVTLCRKGDRDRAGRFLRAMDYLSAKNLELRMKNLELRTTNNEIRRTIYDIRINMGDLDDGPEQMPLAENEVEDTIVSLLSSDPSTSSGWDGEQSRIHRFDLIITHSLCGEYTRHKRHEETAKAVCELWKSGRLPAKQMWMFAYEDDGSATRMADKGKRIPRPIRDADLIVKLSDDIWQKKYNIVTKIYGFGPDSFEAKAAGREEAFWCFGVGDDVQKHLRNRSKEK